MIEVQNMNYFKTLTMLFVATSFAFSPLLAAQDAPPAPKVESPKSAELQPGDEPSENKELKSESTLDQPAENPEPSSEKQDEQDKSADQSEDKSKKKDESQNSEERSDDKPEMKAEADQDPDDKKSDDQKSDEDKSDEKKSDEDKSDEDKSDEKKSDEKKTDEKQSDEKQSDEKKSLAETALERLFSPRNSKDGERVDRFSKQSEEFVKIFEPVIASANESTMTIVAGKRPIALGIVVDSNGLILTKASELRGSLGCRLKDGTIQSAKVIGIDPATDLALLKIDAENLNVVQWSDDPSPETGRWLATPMGSQEEQPTIGVVSVDARKIPASKPFIGIVMDNLPDDAGVRIVKVVSPSPADFADVWVNDVIVSIDDIQVKDQLSLKKALENYDTDDRITLGILRGERKMNIRLTLAEKDKVSPENQRSNYQNSMGSILSRRRKAFPEAFQHDSMLSSRTCGGPIVDISGKVVGINIARAGRVSSLALPASTARAIVEMLKTGDLAPEVVNKETIEKITLELEEMDAKYGHLPDKKSVLERKYNVEQARIDELNRSIADMKKRLEVIEEKSNNYKTELSSVRKQITNIQKNRERLEADREQLRTGSR